MKQALERARQSEASGSKQSFRGIVREATRKRTDSLPSLSAFSSWKRPVNPATFASKMKSRKSRRERGPAAKAAVASADAELAHGAVRFAGSRRRPARWVRADETASPQQVITTLLETWQLAPPGAIISVIGPMDPMVSDLTISDLLNDQQQLSFRRGLKRAATILQAWLVTNGHQAAMSNLIGDALEKTSVPVIGILPNDAIIEHEYLQDSKVHLYGTGVARGARVQSLVGASGRGGALVGPAGRGGPMLKRAATQKLPGLAVALATAAAAAAAEEAAAAKSTRRGSLDRSNTRRLSTDSSMRHERHGSVSSASPEALRSSSGRASTPRASSPENAAKAALLARKRCMLETNHSHFVLVANSEGATELGSELPLRNHLEETLAREKFGATEDMSTPHVTLVLAGDASTLREVLSRLRRGQAVMVLMDTGGAAEDIMGWYDDEDLVSTLSFEDDEYAEEARRLLPQILEEGAKTGASGVAKLRLFEFPSQIELESSEETALDHDILEMILQECASFKHEIVLSVTWGKVEILEHCLERQATLDSDDDRQGLSVALQTALLRRDAAMVSILIDFNVVPRFVDLSCLFVTDLNRYRLKGTTGDCWIEREQHERSNANREVSHARNSIMRRDSVKDQITRPKSRGRPAADGSILDSGWAILQDWVTDYKTHLAARRQHNLMQPTWTDLMLWALLVGERELVRSLWAKSSEPLRSALLASQLARRLSLLPHLRSEQDTLLLQSAQYEDWAMSLLDSIDEPSDALPLLAAVPCVGEAQPLWSGSPLDSAAESDGRLSTPCKRFVAHRHTQHLLEAFFAGDYPHSRARIPTDAGLLSIFLQCVLGFLPGTLCEVMPASAAVEEEPASAGTYTHELEADLEAWEDDGADQTVVAREVDENSWEDLLSDLRSHRWKYYYEVPKVRFVMYLTFHILYLALLTFLAFWASLTPEGNRMSRDVSKSETCFWLWSLLFLAAELTEFKSYDLTGLRAYLRSTWNKVDAGVFFLVLIAACLRLSGLSCGERAWTETGHMEWLGDDLAKCQPFEQWSRNVYAATTLLLFVKLLSYLQYYEIIGVHVIILGNVIMSDVTVFTVIIGIISTGVGSSLSLLLLEFNKSLSSNEDFSRPFFKPLWGLVGYFSVVETEGQYADEEPTKWTLPIFLMVYLFGVIILVNLLVAAMAETYQRVRGEAAENWLFERAQLITEFKRKGVLPPPLNIFSIIFRDVPRGVQLLAAKLKMANMEACCAAWLYRPEDDDTISRDGFKMIPGPNQLRRFQRRLQAALKRCVERQSAARSSELSYQVAQLHTRISDLSADTHAYLESLAKIITQSTEAHKGAATARPSTVRAVRRSSLPTPAAAAAAPGEEPPTAGDGASPTEDRVVAAMQNRRQSRGWADDGELLQALQAHAEAGYASGASPDGRPSRADAPAAASSPMQVDPRSPGASLAKREIGRAARPPASSSPMAQSGSFGGERAERQSRRDRSREAGKPDSSSSFGSSYHRRERANVSGLPSALDALANSAPIVSTVPAALGAPPTRASAAAPAASPLAARADAPLSISVEPGGPSYPVLDASLAHRPAERAAASASGMDGSADARAAERSEWRMVNALENEGSHSYSPERAPSRRPVRDASSTGGSRAAVRFGGAHVASAGDDLAA